MDAGYLFAVVTMALVFVLLLIIFRVHRIVLSIFDNRDPSPPYVVTVDLSDECLPVYTEFKVDDTVVNI